MRAERGRLRRAGDDVEVLHARGVEVVGQEDEAREGAALRNGLTTDEIKEIILSSLGARARRMIESELNDAVAEITKEVIAARRAIAETALRLASSGEISIEVPAPGDAAKDAA